MKIIKILTGLELFVFAILFMVGYQPDIPLDVLKNKYADNDSQFVEIGKMDVHYKIGAQGVPLVLIHGTVE